MDRAAHLQRGLILAAAKIPAAMAAAAVTLAMVFSGGLFRIVRRAGSSHMLGLIVLVEMALLAIVAVFVSPSHIVEVLLYGAGEHTKALQRTGRSDGASSTRPTLHRQPVLTFPLDGLTSQFGLPKPTHLKIDVDGAEASVLIGAGQCLENRDLKKVFIELEAGKAEQQCSRLLAEHHFELAERHRVRRISGGYYENLTNCVFVRTR